MSDFEKQKYEERQKYLKKYDKYFDNIINKLEKITQLLIQLKNLFEKYDTDLLLEDEDLRRHL